MDIASLFIIASIFLLLYGYTLYPISLKLIAKLFKNEIKPINNYEPSISILISVHNEEKFIAEAIKSIFSSSYPFDKIEILIGSDGSNDKTMNILQELSQEYHQVKAFEFDRIGKNAVLNALIDEADSEIICFMDADIRLQPPVIETLLSYLGNDVVGAVIASMKSIGDDSNSAGGYGEILYQKIEQIFRINESKIKSTVNSLGAFYAVKKELVMKLPDDIVADDFYPLLVAMEYKKRVLFVETAVVEEVRGKSTSDEIARRVRASASAMKALSLKASLLLPSNGWVSYFLICHRLLRWSTPILMLIILFSTPFVHSKFLLIIIVSMQIYIYLGGLIGHYLEKLNINIILFKIPLYALTMNIGFLGAIFRFISGRDNSKWQHN